MVLRGEAKEAKIDEEGVLRIKGRVCVPLVDDFLHPILTLSEEVRISLFIAMHLILGWVQC